MVFHRMLWVWMLCVCVVAVCVELCGCCVCVDAVCVFVCVSLCVAVCTVACGLCPHQKLSLLCLCVCVCVCVRAQKQAFAMLICECTNLLAHERDGICPARRSKHKNVAREQRVASAVPMLSTIHPPIPPRPAPSGFHPSLYL